MVYNLLGTFAMLDDKSNARINEVRFIAKKNPTEYSIILNYYLNQIIAIIQLCHCTYLTISTIDAHKWMIRDMLKHDKSEANKVISDLFRYKEEQRLNIYATKKLLEHAINGYCYLEITNHRRKLNITVNSEFDIFLTTPINLKAINLDWKINLKNVTFKCELLTI